MSQYTDWLFYLDRAIFEKTSLQSGAFGRHMTFLFQEAFQSSDLPQIPAENWTHALYADRHTHTHTQTCRYSNKKIPTINQQVQVFFHRVYSLCLYNQPSGAFYKSTLFYSALTGYTHTHTHTFAENTVQTLLRTPFATKHEIKTHIRLHTVFFAGCLLATRLPKALPGVTSTPCITLVLPKCPTTHPLSLLPGPQVLHVSQSV